jgi:hypothetical protein
VIALISVVLVLSLIFLVDRQKRFKLALMELERLWSSGTDSGPNSETNMLREQISALTQENNKIKKELIILSDQKKDARKKLEEEIRSRHVMEREIKNLIGQIKKK